jgi:signal transduction histidine kinase
MVALDTKTLFYLFVAGNLFVIVFFLSYLFYHKSRSALFYLFLVAKIMLVGKWMLFSLRNEISDFYSIAIANGLSLFGLFYEIYCIVFAEQQSNRKRLLHYSIFPVMFYFIFLICLHRSEAQRVILASGFVAFYYVGAAFIILLDKNKTRIQRLSSYFLLLVGLLFVGRALWVMMVDDKIGLFSNNNLQLASYLALFLMSFSSPILFLLILKEKDNDHLRKMNHDLSTIFSIIGHDLRGPLGNLCHLGEILNSETHAKDEVLRQQITKDISQSAKRTYNLLDNLLKWAGTQTGRIGLHPHCFSLRQIIQEQLELLQNEIKRKELQVSPILSNKVQVYADEPTISTVIRNLLSNAVKFTRVRGEISIFEVEHSDQMVTFCIANTGVGMSPEVLEQVFEMGAYVSTPGTNMETGSGLGLKLCREFILKNQGDIHITSEKNKRTNVYITLPTCPEKEVSS